MLALKSFIAAALLCLTSALAAKAGEIPAPKDAPYSGALSLSVDLTDVERRIFIVRESLSVKPGPLTLLCPQ